MSSSTDAPDAPTWTLATLIIGVFGIILGIALPWADLHTGADSTMHLRAGDAATTPPSVLYILAAASLLSGARPTPGSRLAGWLRTAGLLAANAVAVLAIHAVLTIADTLNHMTAIGSGLETEIGLGLGLLLAGGAVTLATTVIRLRDLHEER
jgi:hypothetical protein